jgi:hypothetical protein
MRALHGEFPRLAERVARLRLAALSSRAFASNHENLMIPSRFESPVRVACP